MALTGEDRVLAIELDAGKGARRGQVFVSDYVRDGVNAPADFDLPDNLALDHDGNLFITEDPGGSAPPKPWATTSGFHGSTRVILQGKQVERFLSITDCNAEPTGVYFSKSGRSLFVNVQHRAGDGHDGAFAIQRIGKVDFRVAPN